MTRCKALGGHQRRTSRQQLADPGDGERLAPFRQAACGLAIDPDSVAGGDFGCCQPVFRVVTDEMA
jgi:hypothetical protein